MNGKAMDPEVAAFVEQGLDVVPKVVASLATHVPRHVERAELIRAGALGLVEAAWRFDPCRGVPFERFAATRIRGAVLDAMRADDWAPRSLRSAARRIAMVENALTARYGRGPTIDELAAESGSSREKVQKVKALLEISTVGRLDQESSEDGKALFRSEDLVDSAQLDVADVLEQAELLAYLREAVNALPRRQREVILGQFVHGRTAAELASDFGVTRSRISQLRTDALQELRRSISGRYGPLPPRNDHKPQTEPASLSLPTTA